MSLYLSASAIKDYIECPQRFWYRISKAREAEQTLPMAIGSLIHRVLELESEWTTLQEGLILSASLLEEFGLAGYDVNNLSKYLETFNEYWRTLLSSNDLVEHNFKYQIDTDVYLVGKMDRILRPSETVIDWKTSKDVPTNLNNSIQFVIYDEAYRVIFGKRPASMAMVSLTSPAYVPYVRSEERVSVVFDEIIPKIIHDWRNKNYARFGIFNNKCRMCAFRTHCFDELGYKNELGS